MYKIVVFISFFAISYWLIAVPVSAQEEIQTTNTQVEATVQEEEITAKSLGVENTGILPSSPFYFVKELGRRIKKTFTFNPVKKAELELQYTNERAAEIKKMEEITPSNIEAITKATANYEKNVEQLKNRLEQLKETSDNLNVDKLLNNLVDRSLQHQQLFKDLIAKFEDKTELKERLKVSQEKMDEIITSVPQKFEEVKNNLSPKIQQKIEAAKKTILNIRAQKKANEKACTQEAKICPDGSCVGRTGLNCEFATCPAATNIGQ